MTRLDDYISRRERERETSSKMIKKIIIKYCEFINNKKWREKTKKGLSLDIFEMKIV